MSKRYETLENLAKAFIGECQARNRYTFYASIARKEGYEQIAEVFLLTADNEKEHAEVLYKLLNELKSTLGIKESGVKVEAAVPISLGGTEDNLETAAAGESYEFREMYPRYAEVARREGLNRVAAKLLAIAKAEEHHMKRFQAILNELKNKSIFKKKSKTLWICRKCGYVHEGTEPPMRCPLCGHEKAYFQLICERY